jgi:hypothetical protein
VNPKNQIKYNFDLVFHKNYYGTNTKIIIRGKRKRPRYQLPYETGAYKS